MTLLWPLILLGLCVTTFALPIRINAGGQYIQHIGWRGDSGNLVTGNTTTFATSKPVPMAREWGPVYQSHRWAQSGNMAYRIPVPAGVYTLVLMFSEIWEGSASGVRQFSVKVNGADLNVFAANGQKINGVIDVFAMTGGLNKPLYVPVHGVKPVGGFINIDFIRIPGKNNPMVSGILVNAPNADALLGSEGFPVAAAAAPKIVFTKTSLKTLDGSKDYRVTLITSTTYGPDGRLYLGSLESKVWALTVSKDLRVTKSCYKSTLAKPPQPAFPRAVTGVAFNPHSNDLKLFFTSATHFWLKNNNYTTFAQGWQNGKVQSVSVNSLGGCFSGDIKDVVTGLPVSNHGHAPNKITFLPSGEMLIGIAGTTNGGIPGPELGGIPESPFSGAIISCPSTGTAIKYSNPGDPAKARVIGGDCKVYATGFRNTFGMVLHTNGKLYASDNGPHKVDTPFSGDCKGGKIPSSTYLDRLHIVQPGKCHGHPNHNRLECVFRDPKCVKPLLETLEPSTSGIIEYRANLFGGQMRGDLLLPQFAREGDGAVRRVQLNAAGYIKPNGFTEKFFGASDLSIAEGPRGELIMPKLYQGIVLVAKPLYKAPAIASHLISVVPKRGPAGGGTKVTIHGFNLGSKPTAAFNGKPCSEVEVIDDDTFMCVTPAGIKNTQIHVKVTGKSNTIANLNSGYWYF